ncbi:GntR family transcriptional regulator [Mycolicibacterium komossense]|uniref:GntR family transcriptional regulator n=1 Tax=Mycolicibacterium komossense TaxID=1779 RepID=A0ABT3C6M5_9MYCO|nr:GntR family transcriptional regulator [Mycolicibacterium komossense]MCV7225109.1 GntR family transcriptional regulator [Mycolicibacterium komossense]
MTETIDRNSAIPLYVQLSDLIRERIKRGEWVPDQKIPSENELNQLYGISRMTARQVLSKLVDEGLLFRVQGKGTFVAHRKISTQSPSYRGIREQLEQQGYATSTEILGAALVDADARSAEQLGLPVGTPVYSIRRLRRVDGAPISLHESFVPQSLAPGVIDHDLVGEQLCTVLDRDFGLRMAEVSETLEAATASKSQAKLFGNQPGAPLLLLEQRIAAPDGHPFEFTRIHFRGDVIRLQFHYSH